MATIVEAVYEEEGILRLLAPVPFQVGDHVQVTFTPATNSMQAQDRLQEIIANAPDPHRAAEIAREIAAMSAEAVGEAFSGEDHDKILYGSERGAW